MNIEHQPLNTLPPPYRSWLELYDRLPEDLRNEHVINGEHEQGGKLIKWQVQRDYYLARVAEELLPSRYSRTDLRMLEAVLYNNMKAGGTPSPDPSSFVLRLYKVMLPN